MVSQSVSQWSVNEQSKVSWNLSFVLTKFCSKGRVYSKSLEFSKQTFLRTNFPHFLNFFIFIFSCLNSCKSAEKFFFSYGGVPLLTTKTWKVSIILTKFVEFFKFFKGFFFLLQKISFRSSEKKNKFWSF